MRHPDPIVSDGACGIRPASSRPGAGRHGVGAHALCGERADAAARQHELDAIGVGGGRRSSVRTLSRRGRDSARGSQSQSVKPPDRGPAERRMCRAAAGVGGIVESQRAAGQRQQRRAQRKGYACRSSPAQCGRRRTTAPTIPLVRIAVRLARPKMPRATADAARVSRARAEARNGNRATAPEIRPAARRICNIST